MQRPLDFDDDQPCRGNPSPVRRHNPRFSAGEKLYCREERGPSYRTAEAARLMEQGYGASAAISRAWGDI